MSVDGECAYRIEVYPGYHDSKVDLVILVKGGQLW